MMTNGITEKKTMEPVYFDESKISDEYLNFKELFNNSRDAISLIENEKYIYCNQSALDLFEIKTIDTYLNKAPSSFSPHYQLDGKISSEKAKEMMAIALQKGNHRFEWLHTNRNGENIYVEVLLTKISNLSNKRVLHSVCRDITKRRESEIKLKQREERFRNLFENSLEITCITNTKGFIKFITPAVTELMGYDIKELIGKNIFDYIHEDNKNEAFKRFDKRRKEGGKGEYEIFQVKTKSGNYKHLRMITSNHLNDSSINGFVINAHDVSELIKAEKEKYIAIFDSKENERKRISHDLHDGLGQTIAAAKMYLNYLDLELANQIDKETYITFKTALNLVNEATQETRIISHNFMPRALKHYGLEKVLNDLISTYQNIQPNKAINLVSTINEKRFKERIELTVFRIIQELFSNAIKHAKSSKIMIKLESDSTKLKVQVIDNGTGFDIDNIEKNKNSGIGLISLKQRVNVINGKLIIRSEKNKGSFFSLIVDL
ncbi:MAG: hypothetical protein COB15_08360 [Flavobacteriales bacterium]|nr:MAG: hypothetical protein COB15_08360 [Flavobacteriales bacterium]